MARTAHTILTGLAFTVTLFTAGHALAAGDDSMALVVHVDNFARIPPAYLDRAEGVVTAIYAASGVSVSWVNEDVSLALPADGVRHVRVLLLCENMSSNKIHYDHVPNNVLGQAAPGASRAYIFTYRVRNLALKKTLPFDAVLGRVIAHEVGHLLLPPHSHSTTGIMRENLQLRITGAETFTPAQGEELRVALNQ